MSRFNEPRLNDNQPLNRESRMQKYEFNNQQEYSAWLESELNQFGSIFMEILIQEEISRYLKWIAYSLNLPMFIMCRLLVLVSQGQQFNGANDSVVLQHGSPQQKPAKKIRGLTRRRR